MPDGSHSCHLVAFALVAPELRADSLGGPSRQRGSGQIGLAGCGLAGSL